METIVVKNSKRNDAHSPAVFRPEDYEFVDCIYQGGNVEQLGAAYVKWSREQVEMRRAGKFGAHFDGNWLRRRTCDHCGAHFDYGMVYWHLPTQMHVVVGQQCASERFTFGTREQYVAAQLRAKVAGVREKQKKVRRAEDFLSKTPGLREALDLREKHQILDDMNAKLYNWGSLSDKQIAFALKLAEEIRNPPPPKAEEPKVKVVAGRRDIRGTILGLKTVESAYGDTLKMLVRTEAGEKIWGTVPTGLRMKTEAVKNADGTDSAVTQTARNADLVKGAVVEFTATVKVSETDEFFGIFSRPTGGTIISTPTT